MICPPHLGRIVPTTDITQMFGSSTASNFRRACAVETLERSIEIGQVSKANVECDRRYATVGPSLIHQHAMRAHESSGEHELRERSSFALEELADVAVRHSLAPRNGARRKIAVGETRFDVALDGA